MLVRVLRIGVDATDREINEAKYGAPPPGFDFLVLGHESFGVVEAVGPNVRNPAAGRLCDRHGASPRRVESTIRSASSDMTSEETYYERGIKLAARFFDGVLRRRCRVIVRMPAGLKHLHAAGRADELRHQGPCNRPTKCSAACGVWRPQVAYVMGAGQIGLLSTLVLRLRGLDVYTLARSEPPSLKGRVGRSARRALHQHAQNAAA